MLAAQQVAKYMGRQTPGSSDNCIIGVAAAAAAVGCACVPVQLLVRAAYEGALSHPLIPDPDNLQHLTPETLAAFVAQNYTGE